MRASAHYKSRVVPKVVEERMERIRAHFAAIPDGQGLTAGDCAEMLDVTRTVARETLNILCVEQELQRAMEPLVRNGITYREWVYSKPLRDEPAAEVGRTQAEFMHIVRPAHEAPRVRPPAPAGIFWAGAL